MVERHKVRLKAELTKTRVRRNCATLQDLQSAILAEKRSLLAPNELSEHMYPRWVRINNIKSSLAAQMQTTFSGFERVSQLNELRGANQIYLDAHIPDLVALAPGAIDFTSFKAYKSGEIILQDKASCFPAYLLLGDIESPWLGGDLVDGCAAPGNKTTHLASLLAARKNSQDGNGSQKSKIISMDASVPRSKTLQKMVSVARADKVVTVLAGQDFLALNPEDDKFENVTGLLLDPSCSGSGIIGRDDVPKLVLPSTDKIPKSSNRGTKRKRSTEKEEVHIQAAPDNKPNLDLVNRDRLVKLSNLQSHIVEHALKFSAAKKVTYSTCSIHILENERVVERILASETARRRGWRILRRDEQPQGLRTWRHRGIRRDADNKSKDEEAVNLTEEQLDACLRCWPGDDECTGGFFVAGFVRDDCEAMPSLKEHSSPRQESIHNAESGSEWEGFSD